MTQVRLDIDEYTVRVLDVVKGKFGLKNRSEALKRFAHTYGEKYVLPPVNESVLRELDNLHDKHIKKYGYRGMSEEELDKLLMFKE